MGSLTRRPYSAYILAFIFELENWKVGGRGSRREVQHAKLVASCVFFPAGLSIGASFQEHMIYLLNASHFYIYVAMLPPAARADVDDRRTQRTDPGPARTSGQCCPPGT